MIHLDPRQKDIVKEIINKHIPDREVYVFGSRVKGNMKPYSDLDLCIMGESPLSFEQLAFLREDFSNSDLPFRVDIIEWSTITPDFQEVIQKNSERLFHFR